jgi:hypothetical protein
VVRYDVQKGIRGTLAENGLEERDLTVEDVQNLHLTAQIVQIVRELLDSWVIISLINYATKISFWLKFGNVLSLEPYIKFKINFRG